MDLFLYSPFRIASYAFILLLRYAGHNDATLPIAITTNNARIAIEPISKKPGVLNETWRALLSRPWEPIREKANKLAPTPASPPLPLKQTILQSRWKK